MIPSLDEIPARVFSTKGVRTPGGTTSVELGGQAVSPYIRGVQELWDSGPGVGVRENVEGRLSSLPSSTITDDSTPTTTGSFPGIEPTLFVEGNAFRFDSFGGDDDDTKTVSGTDTIQILFMQVFTAVQTVHEWRGTEGLMHYQFSDQSTFDGEPTFVYSSQDGAPIDFDNPDNPTTGGVFYETLHPQFLIKDHLMLVDWFSADGNDMTMRGEFFDSLFVPFFNTSFCDVLFKNAATEEYVSEFFASTKFTANTTETIISDTVTPVQIAGTYVAGNLSNYTESSGVLTAAQSHESGFITNVFKAIQKVSARVLIEQEPGIESDVLDIGIYRDGVLIPNTLKTLTMGVSFGQNPNAIEFQMSESITDATDLEAYDVRVINTSNATNVTATDCDLVIGV